MLSPLRRKAIALQPGVAAATSAGKPERARVEITSKGEVSKIPKTLRHTKNFTACHTSRAADAGWHGCKFLVALSLNLSRDKSECAGLQPLLSWLSCPAPTQNEHVVRARDHGHFPQEESMEVAPQCQVVGFGLPVEQDLPRLNQDTRPQPTDVFEVPLALRSKHDHGGHGPKICRLAGRFPGSSFLTSAWQQQSGRLGLAPTLLRKQHTSTPGGLPTRASFGHTLCRSSSWG